MVRVGVQKKRRAAKRYRSIQNFKRQIDRVKKRVFGGEHSIARQTVEVLNSMANDMAHRFATEARELSIKEGRVTITQRDMQFAVRLILPAGVAKLVNENVNKRLDGRRTEGEDGDEIRLDDDNVREAEAPDDTRSAGERRADGDDSMSAHSDLSYVPSHTPHSTARRNSARPTAGSTPSQGSKRGRKKRPISSVHSHTILEYFSRTNSSTVSTMGDDVIPEHFSRTSSSTMGDDEVAPRPQLAMKTVAKPPADQVIDMTTDSDDDGDDESTASGF